MVVWSKLVHFSIRLSHQGPCLQQPCWLLHPITGYCGKFRKLLSGCVYSSNLFATPGKQRPSSLLCVSLSSNECPQRAHSRSRKLAVCLAITWVAHEVEPSLVGATPSVACALRRHFISSMARWLTNREACCVQDGTLYSGSRKESSQTKTGSATTEGGAGQIYRALDLRRPADPAEAPPIRWLDVHDRGCVTGNQ